MDILNDIIGEKGSEIIGALLNQGFNAENAQSFLGESGNSIMSALNSGNVDLSVDDAEENTASIINNIDIASLASKLGITNDMAQSGLKTIIPLIMDAVKNKLGDAAGIMSLLSNTEDAGGLLQSVRSLF